MPKITFSITADYDNQPVTADDIQSSVEYSFDVPAHVVLSLSDIEYHFYNWLRAQGYVI